MFNPFAETTGANPPDEELVQQATAGDRDALERLIRRHQGWVYNVAVRMVWRTDRAEDATQEILIKIVTHLGSFEGKSQFRTWAYRIAVNHLLNVQKSDMERQGVTFTDLGREMDSLPDLELPDPKSVPVELPLLVEEAKVGCTTAMLMCLDRRQRLAFILGEVFGASDRIGAEVMEVSPDNFRQLLARARRDLYSFMNGTCGLVNPSNPCRCAKKAQAFIDKGYLDPALLQFTAERVRHVRKVAPSRLEEMEALADRQHAEVFRDHAFLPVKDQVAVLRRLLDDPQGRRVVEQDF
jgi:RNA polymerase sigma factor (sigma-70 family)